MDIIAHPAGVNKLPTGEDMGMLITAYAQQIGKGLPDKRLRTVLGKALIGIVTCCSPIIARMASLSSTRSKEPEAPAKQLYRFFANVRVTTHDLWKGVYRYTRTLVDAEHPTVVPVVIDGVNLEKPYARKTPGLSTIHKKAAPNRRHDKDLTKGFPALAAVALTCGQPALTFAHLFSYTAMAFVSVKREIRRAILTTLVVLTGYTVRFIADREFDDDQVMAWMASRGQFLVRAYHHRIIDIWDERAQTWRRSSMQECADTLPLPARFGAEFRHARKVRPSTVRLGYCRFRLPKANNLACWLIVAHADIFRKPLWLLTNVPIPDQETAVALWWEFRTRPKVEDLFRLLQERGFDIEDMRLRTQERLERLMAAVWAAAQFLWRLSFTLPQHGQAWLRRLGGKTHDARGSNGLYLFLYGLSDLLRAHFVEQLRQRCEQRWFVRRFP